MTGFGKLFRTTAFKLSLVYLIAFAVGAGLVLGKVAWDVKNLVDQQTAQTVEAEIKGLSEQYSQGGIWQLVDVVERRTLRPGGSLYLVTTPTGEAIAGNVETLPQGILNRPGVVETQYQRPGESPDERHRALARIFVLPGGFRLLVGHDLEDRESVSRVMNQALVTSLLWLTAIGTLGGLFVARRVLHRVDAMSASARTIMGGDLSGRLPLAGTGDELDRLAENLNALLERISELMTGLKEVSDNIAHDLKTPLTRLRNRAEAALRTANSTGEYRASLEQVIEESDGLIRIFNALLMIARAEAGSECAGMADFDAAEVARDVAELYEPLAETEDVAFDVDVGAGLIVYGNRELIGQAVANLVDNALKYGKPAEPGKPHGVRIAARRTDGEVEIEVSDRGSGIAIEDRGRVINRFVRLEGSRSRPGSGLGLSLAAAIAHLHHGALRIEDNAPGLRVVITLPVTIPHVATIAAASPQPVQVPHLSAAQ
ncbi:MAG TPA: ATP-binding protein [Beijerinckiaceae bacterium]|nr:ATP-binding protein [Beijerinckiaceae bacterium]